MNNLDSTDISIITLEVQEYAQLIAKINHNFTQILQLPGFKGVRGDDGSDAVGVDGVRGSKWMVVDVESFKTFYGTITTAGQITTQFINGELINDVSVLMDALLTDSLINNDIIVLPDGKVIQFDQDNVIFVDTTITFAGNSSLTEQRVMDIVTSILTANPTTSAIFKTFAAYGKNVTDLVGGLNGVLNPDTAIDPQVIGSALGVPITDFNFIGLVEAVSNNNSNVFVTSEIKKYHDILQKTLGTTSLNYAPARHDSPAIVVMQDNLENGLMLGYKEANDFREFAKVYHDGTSLNIVSGYSNNESQFGVIRLRKENMQLVADLITIPKSLVVGTTFTTSNIKDLVTSVEIGHNVNLITLLKETVLPSLKITSLTSATFLNTDGSGKVGKSEYTVSKSTEPTSNSDIKIPTTKWVTTTTYTRTESDTRYLRVANNLSDGNAQSMRNNLGVLSESQISTTYAKLSNNLSDIPVPSTARTNLGVLSGTEIDGAYMAKSRNLSDISDKNVARNNLSVMSIGDIHTRIFGGKYYVGDLPNTITKYTIPFNKTLPTINYIVQITIQSNGNVDTDNEIYEQILVKNLQTTSFDVWIREKSSGASPVQNISIMWMVLVPTNYNGVVD